MLVLRLLDYLADTRHARLETHSGPSCECQCRHITHYGYGTMLPTYVCYGEMMWRYFLAENKWIRATELVQYLWLFSEGERREPSIGIRWYDVSTPVGEGHPLSLPR
jgi:hypothetical protein